MAAKRIRRDHESISELFGDVVQDRPSFLFVDADEIGLDRAEAGASPVPAAATAERAAFDAEEPPAPPPVQGPPRPRGVDPERSGRVLFKDDRGLLSGVVMLHGLITVLTLGFWRFWQTTEQRQVVWAHTELDGEPLEYLGRGVELLLGALIAVVFLGAMMATAQLSLVFLGLAAMPTLPDLGGAPTEMLPLAVAAALGLPPLFQYATFRARRYRLSRTRWRGLRFGMEGSGLSLVGLWLMWLPAVALSAGFAYPFWRWARERHLTRRTLWGRERFGFEGSPFGLVLHWLPLWGLVVGGAAALAVPAVREALMGLAAQAGGALGFRMGFAMEAMAIVAAIGASLAVALLGLNYRAAETRLFWRARRLLGARADCDFSVWSLVDALVAVIGRNIWPGFGIWLVSVAVMAFAVFGAIAIESRGGGGLGVPELDGLGEALFGAVGSSWRAQAMLMLGVGVTYAISTVFTMWLWTAVYARRIHAHVCDSLMVHGLETLEDGRGRARGANRDAEGFADALDLGAGF
jgi:uncharacterized membrane protein YjgN (DUF898 family)